jgi:hypothetical protein
MRVCWLTVGALVAATPRCSEACEPVSPSASQAFAARFIVRGRVMGSRWIQPATLLVHVAVEGVIKGSAPNTLDAASPCALPVKDGEIVIVFNNDAQSQAYPTEIYEQDLRSALHGGAYAH